MLPERPSPPDSPGSPLQVPLRSRENRTTFQGETGVGSGTSIRVGGVRKGSGGGGGWLGFSIRSLSRGRPPKGRGSIRGNRPPPWIFRWVGDFRYRNPFFRGSESNYGFLSFSFFRDFIIEPPVFFFFFFFSRGKGSGGRDSIIERPFFRGSEFN